MVQDSVGDVIVSAMSVVLFGLSLPR
jgi:hypothetical protein